MKKKLKISLAIIAGVVVIGIGSLVYNYYGLYKNMTTDPEEISSEEQIENPFDKIGDTENEEVLDENGNKVVPNDEANGQVKDKDKKQAKIDKEKHANDTPKQETVVDKQAKDPDYIAIVEPYKQRFQNLQAKQEGQLNALVEQGKAEYIEAKKNGKSPAPLAAKYANEARKLESRSQAEFNSLKSDLNNALKGQSYDPAIVKEVEGYYKQRKNSMQSEILGKIKGS